MSLIVSRRGNIVANTGAQRTLVVSGRRRRNNQSGNNQGASSNAQQLILRSAQVLPGVAGSRPRRRRRARGVVTSVSAPATYGGVMVGGRPTYRSSTKEGGMIVSHSEILSSELGTNGFEATRWAMVPSVFPWLEGVAHNWSRFRWLSLSVEFVTSSPTSQGGSVAMGASYDEIDQLPSSIGEMKELAHSCVLPVWSTPGSVPHRVVFDCSNWGRPNYSFLPIGTGEGPGPVLPDSLQAYVPGYFTFGKATQVNGQQIGHVVVRYVIEFLDPIPSRINHEAVVAENERSLITRRAVPGPPNPASPDELLRQAVVQLATLTVRAAHAQDAEDAED